MGSSGKGWKGERSKMRRYLVCVMYRRPHIRTHLLRDSRIAAALYLAYSSSDFSNDERSARPNINPKDQKK